LNNSTNMTRGLIDGYELGLGFPYFRTLRREVFKGSEEILLPYCGYNSMNIIDLETLAKIIAESAIQNLEGDMLIGNPVAINTREYYKHAALAFGFGQGVIDGFDRRFGEYKGSLDAVIPSFMSQSWQLDLHRMRELTDAILIDDVEWVASLRQAFLESTQVPIGESQPIIDRMIM
jgi:hypothetical protein